MTRKFLRRLSRKNFLVKNKLTRKNLNRLCEENSTATKTLVVHSEDVDYEPFFPNTYTVTKRRDVPADLHVDSYYKDLSRIPSSSYEVILCTGLLEHIPDPQKIVDDFYRILKPGGKIVLSASSVFSLHESPDDFFHFTPYGVKLLFERWTRVDIKGSSQPFETIAILLQRINLQCDIFFPVRILVELFYLIIPILDRFIVRQYSTRQFRNEYSEIDSMMPSNVQVVAFK